MSYESPLAMCNGMKKAELMPVREVTDISSHSDARRRELTTTTTPPCLGRYRILEPRAAPSLSTNSLHANNANVENRRNNNTRSTRFAPLMPALPDTPLLDNNNEYGFLSIPEPLTVEQQHTRSENLLQVPELPDTSDESRNGSLYFYCDGDFAFPPLMPLALSPSESNMTCFGDVSHTVPVRHVTSNFY